jgi:ABC-type histidine transport system ATPase subunit
MDDGLIAEEGAPEKIFSKPENPRTQEFFRKMNIMAQPEYMI